MDTLLTEESKCPLCGVHNLVWHDMEKLSQLTGVPIPSVDVRGAVYTVEGEKVAHGTACWDAPFGDECGACLRTVLNQETALIGPNGMCHD